MHGTRFEPVKLCRLDRRFLLSGAFSIPVPLISPHVAGVAIR